MIETTAFILGWVISAILWAPFCGYYGQTRGIEGRRGFYLGAACGVLTAIFMRRLPLTVPEKGRRAARRLRAAGYKYSHETASTS
jgi:hypothetical protein